MPSSPKSPTPRNSSKDSLKGSPKLPHRPPARRAHSSGSHDSHRSSRVRPTTSRRHTVPGQIRLSERPLPPLPEEPSRPRPVHRRVNSMPLPTKDGRHVLIPVPIRARDAESPVYVKAPKGQDVQFVFSPPKKKSFISRLLDKIEWEEGGSDAGKPFRYPKPNRLSAKPFYRRLLP